MAKKKKDLGSVLGPTGRDANISSATVTINPGHLDEPTVEVLVGGSPGDNTLDFTFNGLQGEKGDKGEKGEKGDSYEPPGTIDQIILGDGTTQDIDEFIVKNSPMTKKCLALDSGGDGNTPYHRYGSLPKVEGEVSQLVLHVRSITDNDAFSGILSVTTSNNPELSWEVVTRGVPFDKFMIVPNEESYDLYCPCYDEGSGYQFSVISEKSIDNSWVMTDSIDEGVSDPSNESTVYGKTVTVLNNSVSSTRLRDLDLDTMDLDDLKGCKWWNRIGWAKTGNTCQNLPPDVDAFGLIIFRASESDTGQLILGDYRNCMYIRRGNDDGWEDWDRIHPPVSEKSV